MSQYLVWNYVSPGHHPTDGNLSIAPEYIDLDFLKIPKQEVIQYGHKIEVNYYDRYDYQTKEFIERVARITRTAIYDDRGVPIKLQKTIAWKKTDGEWGGLTAWEEPIRNPKVFMQKVRARAIEELIDIAYNYGFKDKILELFEAYTLLISIYKDGGSPKLRDAIAIAEDSWLDEVNEETGNKPRDVLVQYLSIGVVA